MLFCIFFLIDTKIIYFEHNMRKLLGINSNMQYVNIHKHIFFNWFYLFFRLFCGFFFLVVSPFNDFRGS